MAEKEEEGITDELIDRVVNLVETAEIFAATFGGTVSEATRSIMRVYQATRKVGKKGLADFLTSKTKGIQ